MSDGVISDGVLSDGSPTVLGTIASFGGTAEPDDGRRALDSLRRLHAERHELVLRRLEVRTELAFQRRRAERLELDGSTRLQGPVEAKRFEAALLAAANLAIEARAVDQRLRFLQRELAIAVRKAGLALASRPPLNRPISRARS